MTWIKAIRVIVFRLLLEITVTYLTKNFTRKELECGCCGACNMDDEFLANLQEVRELVGRPFTINSGYRCNKFNESIGGSPRSKHLTGQAVDISIKNWLGQDIHTLLMELTTVPASTGIGIYSSWIHFDMRDGDRAWVKV